MTQLYVSVDASTKDGLKKIDRPLFRDFWDRFLASLRALSDKVGNFDVFWLIYQSKSGFDAVILLIGWQKRHLEYESLKLSVWENFGESGVMVGV